MLDFQVSSDDSILELIDFCLSYMNMFMKGSLGVPSSSRGNNLLQCKIKLYTID